jgi:response regulator of citrate/malate metabolism
MEVLLIEDDLFLADSTKAWLEEVHGHSVRVASSLPRAELLLSEKLPHVILSDNNLPDGLGREFLPKVKKDHPECYCFLWSGVLTEDERKIEDQIDGCFSKGLRGLDELGDALRKITAQTGPQ